MCQHRNRAMRSLLKAAGGEDRKVARQRTRSSSRSSDWIWSISASRALRSDELSVIPVTPLGSLTIRRLGFYRRGLARNDAVDALAVDRLGLERETKLLAHDACEEATHRVLLPAGRLHDRGNSC